MEKDTIKTILSKLVNPERVHVLWAAEGLYAVIESAENTNDTLGWFRHNSNNLEEGLEVAGLSWCYVFETAPNNPPLIYMYIGDDITKDFVMNEISDAIDCLPEGRELHIVDDSFSTLDADQYDNSITEMEKVAVRYASDVFRVEEI